MEKDLAASPLRVKADTVPPGLHLLLDFWGGRYARDVKAIEQALKAAASACGATVLEVILHSFGENAGVTGVAVLAESHISIHTWPETDYIALDVFTCGTCDAHKAADELIRHFQPVKYEIGAHKRGEKKPVKKREKLKM
ncbi:MAG: adenosylmethionine decarboxylase [Alphaproteobacteria bacterium]